MSLLIETIRIYNGKVYNIALHNKRLNRSRQQLFNSTNPIKLRPLIKIPSNHRKGLVKCRVLYKQGIHDIQYEKYQIKDLKTLQCVYTSGLVYDHKFDDRRTLSKLFKARKTADDIIIINNELITDSYYCNLAFYDGSQWLSPKDCLLRGTAREKLIDAGKIKLTNLKITDLNNFSHISLFNAMIPFKYHRIPCNRIRL